MADFSFIETTRTPFLRSHKWGQSLERFFREENNERFLVAHTINSYLSDCLVSRPYSETLVLFEKSAPRCCITLSPARARYDLFLATYVVNETLASSRTQAGSFPQEIARQLPMFSYFFEDAMYDE